MQDISELSAALKEVIASSSTGPDAGETSLLSVLETHLSSPVPAVRRATIEALYEVLTDPTVEDLQQRRDLLLAETSLTLVPLLLPLFSLAPWSLTALLLLIARAARPREVFLALDEALQGIEDRAVRFEVSENEDEEGVEPVDDGMEIAELVGELEVVLKCLVIAFPRLPNVRSTPTLLTLSDNLLTLIPILAVECDSAQSRQLLKSTCELVLAAWEWSQSTSDAGGEQRAICSQIFFAAVHLFGRNVDAGLLRQWFFATFPRFDLHPSAKSQDEGGKQALEKASETLNALSIKPLDLQTNLTRRPSTSPTNHAHAAYASLILLSSLLVLHPAQAHVPETRLEDCVDLLISTLSSGMVDSAATWLWCTIHHAGEGEIKLEAAQQVVEVLVPLVASEPDPSMRLALWKIVPAIFDKVSAGSDQLTLLGQLLDPSNPFEQVRIETLSLVRELLSKAAFSSSVTNSSNPSSILQPSLLTLLTIIPANLSTSLSVFLASPECIWTASLLDTLRLLHTLDVKNQTGVRSKENVEKMERELVQPVEKQVAEFRREMEQAERSSAGNEAGGFRGEDFAQARLEDTVVRLREAFDAPTL